MVQPFIVKTARGERKIGSGEPCFIIAEMSANHNQDFEQAKAIVRAAAEAGADAIKLQSYLPDSLSMDADKPWFKVGGEKNPEEWKGGQTFYQLYQKAFTPREWHQPLKELAESLGLLFFSTPYAPQDVDFLETLPVELYKVASYEVTNIPFLKRVAQTGKPVIMSIGFANLEEIELAVQTLRDGGVKDLAILHCVTSYADKPVYDASNLRTIADLAQRFGVVAGFSDNNGGIEVPILAAAMGASIIEKHFIIDNATGLDDRFSLRVEGFKKMVEQIQFNEKIMGTVAYGPQTDAEKYNRGFRHSLYALKNIKQGEQLTSENVRFFRPEGGLAPKYYDEVLAKKTAQDIERGTPLSWDLLV